MATPGSQAEEIDSLLSKLNLHRECKYEKLKPRQQEVIFACRDSDVLAVLPTGYGKTVIIEALPYLSDATCVIIATPLNAIMEEQAKRFGDRALVVDADYLKVLEKSDGTSSQSLDNVNYIIGHPEMLLRPEFKKFLLRPSVSSKVSHLVIDEAHCILSWGKSKFRPAYLNLGILRAILPEAKVLALTATATQKSEREIKEVLLMRSTKVVRESPDRPNVFLEVKKRQPSTGGDYTPAASYSKVLDPYFIRLKQDGQETPKTIVYLPVYWCGAMHARAKFRFLDDSHHDGIQRMVAQYHAPQSKQMKSLITNDMKSSEGEVRLLFATQAYGMGADAQNVREVVHVGPPGGIETYIQEIGRSGRDGKPARATLFYNNSDISSNAPTSDEMRLYCKTEGCRREFLLDYFGFQLDSKDPHTCCDNCMCKCKCPSCQTTVPVAPAKKPVLKGNKEVAKPLLLGYFADENALIKDFCLPECCPAHHFSVGGQVRSPSQ